MNDLDEARHRLHKKLEETFAEVMSAGNASLAAGYIHDLCRATSSALIDAKLRQQKPDKLNDAAEAVRLALTEPHGDDVECLAAAIGDILDHLRASAPSAATLSERMLAAVARARNPIARIPEPSAANRPGKGEAAVELGTVECQSCGAPKHMQGLCTNCTDPVTDEELEHEARHAGWKPVKQGDPAPSPLLVLSWMRWALDCGYRRGVAYGSAESPGAPVVAPAEVAGERPTDEELQRAYGEPLHHLATRHDMDRHTTRLRAVADYVLRFARAPLVAEIAELRAANHLALTAHAAMKDARDAVTRQLDAILPVARAAVADVTTEHRSVEDSDASSQALERAVDALPADVREELGRDG